MLERRHKRVVMSGGDLHKDLERGERRIEGEKKT
jgi:hypothetical protein